MYNYEKEVKEGLGEESYNTCLHFCDSGKVTQKHVEDIALCLDPRIRASLVNQEHIQDPRSSLRFVLSEWFRYANEDTEAFQLFNLDTLIKILRDPSIKQYPLVQILENRSFDRSQMMKYGQWKSEGQIIDKVGENPLHKMRSEGQLQVNVSSSNGDLHPLIQLSSEAGLQARAPPSEHFTRINTKFYIENPDPVPLDDELISAIAYPLRGGRDGDVMAALAVRTGQYDTFKILSEQKDERMDVVMKHLLTAWRDEGQETEINTFNLLREFPELSKSVDVLKVHLAKRRSENTHTFPMKTQAEDSSEKEHLSLKNEIPEKESTPISRRELNLIIMDSKKIKNKDKNIIIFNNLASNLGVPSSITKVAAMSKTPKMNEVMENILLAWEQARENSLTAEELLEALRSSNQGQDPDVFFSSKALLTIYIEELRTPSNVWMLSVAQVAATLRVGSSIQGKFGTIRKIFK